MDTIWTENHPQLCFLQLCIFCSIYNQENNEGRFYTCNSTNVLMYLNMKLIVRQKQHTNKWMVIIMCWNIMISVIWPRRTIWWNINYDKGQIIRDQKYSNLLVVPACLYWRIYVCMYQLEYMYQCIRTNPTVIIKEWTVRPKCISWAKYVYRCMTVSTYTYMLVLACIWVLGGQQKLFLKR